VLSICARHKVDQQSLVGNLFLDSGRDTKIVVAEMAGRGGFRIAVPVKEALIAALIALKIDILIVDPFIKAHRVAENDNVAMDAVATVFAEIADAANCSVDLVQHTRKTNDEEIGLVDARGAGSTTAAARMVRVLNRLPKSSAPLAGLKEEQARYHIRVDDDAKSNLAPPQKATWFRLANVGLGNFGPDPALDDEDHVQVAEPWDWPDAFEGVGLDALREVQRQVAERPRRADRQAKDWIGFVVIDTLGLDREDKIALAKAKELIRQWRENHMFKIVEMPDERRKPVQFVVVDQFAN
jgi:AAA domain